MDQEVEVRDTFAQQDHQVAYIFDPDHGDDSPRDQRAPKRRRLSKGASKKSVGSGEAPLFVPLLNGAEQEAFAILRESNSATLDQVSAFVNDAAAVGTDQIPSAFLVTGPNIASQGLLFEQLAETLGQQPASRFVRLKSSETATLKAALKKAIRDAMATAGDEGEGLQIDDAQNGRRYLEYDLEALEAFIKPLRCEHVFVAFQDSEGFDSGLLSDLIALFHSWRPRIPFTLLFGVATSVELLQARLLKSACRLVYGAQFDAAQAGNIVETVFKGAIAAADVPLIVGAPLLQSMLDRQHEQVAGIQSFISSLKVFRGLMFSSSTVMEMSDLEKYAYMCHFYANPLSILCSPDGDDLLQVEHLEAARNLPSFRHTVEREVEKNTRESLQHAKSLLDNNDYLLGQIRRGKTTKQTCAERHLRSLLISQAAGAQRGSFSRVYADSMGGGASMPPGQSTALVAAIRRMNPDELSVALGGIIGIFKEGDAMLRLGPSDNEQDQQARSTLETKLEDLKRLKANADEQGMSLRSKYSGQSKIMRTTVIAQKVQLSQDSAALRDEDKRFTEIVDHVTDALAAYSPSTNPSDVLFAECWLYDSKSPSRQVFVPRPRAVFERSLGRPHDYLGCSCCKAGGEGLQATLPATSILYQLYLETGSLINVADLWSAFHALVSEKEDDDRKTLVMFYRGLAELRALGFVKNSKKKVDHIAKVKWL
ncbi:origin recognition complex subunit [Metarhizium album ARSEF 1941]|uniref:Origin recognition complex subunit n=1 Tax=Metarhizium album (strain ARSEF 1941) TaxID=1081103 RepID=A0A0B2WNB7_METAS|nr:origin recognition complex subunit [Metarhizium album ARSEF 1941]KHN94500.1 origin recognition complex subunit [Metarhizium album ARSEF 1941]